MGQLAFGVVGAAVGFVASGYNPAGAQWGWAIGAAIGGVVLAPDGAQTVGPRLSDLQSNISTYGQPIPRAYGQVGFYGSLIYMDDLTEHISVQEQGKGGDPATQTTFSYSATFALLLCRGEVQSIPGTVPITSLLRVGFNEKMYFDVRDETNLEAMNASAYFSQYFKFYPGSQTQEPDPTMESILGVGNVPAYLGRSYLMFKDLPLAFVQNQPPGVLRIFVEVLMSGVPTTGLRILKQLANAPGSNGTNQLIMPVFEGVVRVLQQPPDDFVYVNSVNGDNLAIDSRTEQEDEWPTAGTIAGDCAITRLYDGNEMRAHRGTLQLNDPLQNIYAILEDGGFVSALDILPDLTEWCHGIIPSADQQHVYIFTGPTNTAVTNYHLIAWRLNTDEFELVQSGAVGTNNLSPGPFGPSSQGSAGYSGMAEQDLRWIWYFTTSGGPPGFTLYYVADDLTIDIADSLAESSFIGSSPSQIWADNGLAYCFGGTYYYVLTRNDGPPANTQTLQEVFEAECTLAGLSGAQNDGSFGSGIVVDGMYIRRLAPTRGVIQALEPAYFFDTKESNGVLSGVLRGGATVATITDDELGASTTGKADFDLIKPERSDEDSLPGEVIVTYMDRASDYQVAAQHDRRSTVETDQPINMELPLVVSPDAARQIGSVWLYNQWAGRTRRTVRVPRKYSYLEPTDPITLETDAAAFDVRIVAIKTNDAFLELECVDEEIGVYDQNSEGAEIIGAGAEIQTPTPTKLVLLDIPMLREADNDPGFYVAAAGYGAGWPGALILRSTDGGIVFTTVTSITTPATMGNVSTALGDYTGPMGYDAVNQIEVNLFGSASALSSVTDAQLLQGANAIALGNPTDGYELLQFKTATIVTGNKWRLSQLVRGRRGTEAQMSTHAAYETMVLLDENTLRRIAITDPSIGIENHYKAVTFGQLATNASTQALTNTAASLKPYSPVNGRGSGFGGDVTITWTRRGRIQNDWNDGVELTLGEASELYIVEIWNALNTAVVRTISGISSPTTVYSAANQTTDFGSPPSSLNVRIYQISATVGRGFPFIGTLS